MELKLTKNNPKAAFEFTYNFSKFIVESFTVPGLHPDDLPIINIQVNHEGKTESYTIDMANELKDDMEEPIFEVHTSFPIKDEITKTMQKNKTDWIGFNLEKGEWIKVNYTTLGGAKQIK